jgi:SAM-dependent methyltransferase
VTDQGARYDRFARGYETWWGPVQRPSPHRLLDRLDQTLRGSRTAVDIGTGTGTLTREALARYPGLRITAVDASQEMVAGLTQTVGADASRLEVHVADAAALPAADASFDVAMSSFVLQLVASRAAALREIRRVLRPGGTLGYVTWLVDRRPFLPDRLFDDLLDAFGYDDEPGDGRCGDVPSGARGAAELRRAGFRSVTAEESLLEHAFTVDGYIGFLTEYDEEALFEEMGRRERHRFLARLREGLMALPDDALVFRAGIVYATGIRSDG